MAAAASAAAAAAGKGKASAPAGDGKKRRANGSDAETTGVLTKDEASDWLAALRAEMVDHMDQGFSRFGSAFMGNIGQKIQKIEADSMRQFSE